MVKGIRVPLVHEDLVVMRKQAPPIDTAQSGVILSGPGVLLAFKFFMAVSNSWGAHSVAVTCAPTCDNGLGCSGSWPSGFFHWTLDRYSAAALTKFSPVM